MAEPIFSLEELKTFENRIREIDNDKINFSKWEERQAAIDTMRNAHFAKAVARIRKGRMVEFLNYLVVLVGTKGIGGDIRLWDAFASADDREYVDTVLDHSTPLNYRYLQMFLRAVLVAHRNWALTAFVKFLRGNKVAGGKANELEGFGDFHKDSGWTEAEVKAVGDVLFDERSEVAKLFMQYDADLMDRVYKESQENTDISYSAQFAATSKIISKEFLEELIALLEKRTLAPKPTNSKKQFKPRVPKVFKVGDTIQKNTISDLLPLSIVEIKVTARMKREDKNAPTTIQIVLVEKSMPRYYLNIWRIVDGKAYLPDLSYPLFDRERPSLEGAVYKGQWEAGVQAHKPRYKYPHDYINV